jgi:anion-transporting  ArsA/GET3 family ATPase
MSASTTEFARPATEEALNELADRLRERNYEVLIVDTAADAKAAVLARIPDGAEVHSGKSKTLEDAGVFQHLMESDRYNFIRKRFMKMDRKTQADEMRKLVASPDYMLGSVQAVTKAGQLVIASASGSQIGPLSAGARTVILVVGSQKIVPNLDEALRRINEHVLPYEDTRLREQMGIGTKLTRVLILEGDFMPGRTTVILVRDPIGV